MNNQPESLVYSKDRIVEICSWAHFHGFIGATCVLCKSTCNVLVGPGWMCPGCGVYNESLSGDKCDPFETPDYGTPRAVIEEGCQVWKNQCGGESG